MSFWLIYHNRACNYSVGFYFLCPCKIFHLWGMQLTTNSSTPWMCWLALRWDFRICELKSFRLICWTTHNVIWLVIQNRGFKTSVLRYARISSLLRTRLRKPPPQRREHQLCIYTPCDRRRIIRFWRGLLHSIAFWLLQKLFLTGWARPRKNYSGTGSKKTSFLVIFHPTMVAVESGFFIDYRCCQPLRQEKTIFTFL